MDCPHTDLTLDQDHSTRVRNVYRCACGVMGYRLWSRSRGLGPFTLYPDAEKVLQSWQDNETTHDWHKKRAMKRRDSRDLYTGNEPD
jgi:hypothetical protein